MGDPQSPAVRKCSECDALFQDWRKLGHCDDCDRKMMRDKKMAEYATPLSNHYQYQAKKTWYTDQWGRRILYDSGMEARMARLLDKHGIEFDAHVKFEGLMTPEHKPFTYTIDFVMKTAQKFIGIPDILNAIEVKGALSKHDMVRIEALGYFKGVKAWIITDTLISFWEAEGLK